MKDLLVKLKVWGCDIDGAMERFLDDEEMYMDFLKDVVNDESLINLEKYIHEGNAKEAFDCAHTLKGVYGNMGLTPLYDLDVEIVEPLRKGNVEGLEEKLAKLIDVNNDLKKMILIN